MSFWGALKGLLSALTRPRRPPPAGPTSQGLMKPSAFYGALRTGNMLGPLLSQDEVDGCAAVLQACVGLPISWTAYAFATAYHETAHTLKPIKELGGEAYYTRMYDIEGNRPEVAAALGNTQPGDGAKFCGRGYPQLTGRKNYARASRIVGVDLIAEPDLALKPLIAAAIMRSGMKQGWFTGKGFSDFLTDVATEAQFTNARRIINGTDRAQLIAGYAVQFQDALRAGQWS